MTVTMARIVLASLVEPGNAVLARLVRTSGPAEALRRLLGEPEAPHDLVTLSAAAKARLGDRDPWRLAEDARSAADRLGARLVTPEDPDWPTRADELARMSRGGATGIDVDSQPPVCLWVRGALPVADTVDRSVSVVGARTATPYGLYMATEISFGLAESGWTVVSGGAYGIDAAAHRAAMSAGGRTVAVLACGIDTVYPLAHAGLFEQIADTGLLLTEWPPGATPHRTRFLVRNRLIAALSRGTVVVEAAARSGARSTARRAFQLNRALMACPGPATSPTSEGCHAEIREHHARLVTTPEQVLEEVGRIGEYLAPPVRGRATERDGLDDLAARVLDAVPRGHAISAAEIAVVAGVSPTDARRNLPALVARELVVEDDHGLFQTRRRPSTRPAGRRG
ncbi:DNA processing protein DprA [Longispora fulva]|uniref:DNA processing protein n=1 Tax=Longispora fulva TaxID=619741 RepID=A0A8J7GMP0_9ACTN|nr:DNA-processing protein DprA [Longispora fulva]MBG6141161.1 DNA processing protein [Longispora fulva]GIG62845.1 DNA processing protein DprA [Longispora fulva]